MHSVVVVKACDWSAGIIGVELRIATDNNLFGVCNAIENKTDMFPKSGELSLYQIFPTLESIQKLFRNLKPTPRRRSQS